MATLLIDTAAIRERIKELGLSERTVAKKMGLAHSKLSLGLNHKRRFSFGEAKALSEVIELPFRTVLEAFGIETTDPKDYFQHVMGVIDEFDTIVIAQGEDKDKPVPVTFSGYDGLAFRIGTGHYSPRYRAGEYIGSLSTDRTIVMSLIPESEFARQELEALTGQEVIAGLDDGRMVFRVLQKGVSPNTFILTSLHPAAAPLIAPKMIFVAPIDWHIPQPYVREWPLHQIHKSPSEVREGRNTFLRIFKDFQDIKADVAGTAEKITTD